MTPAALRAIADAAEALARVAREAAEDGGADPSKLLTLRQAAEFACTSLRTVRDAIRHGDLDAFGGQRDRTVRRGDVLLWIESRRLPVLQGPDDADIQRRMARLARAARRRARKEKRA
jgi:hypothetical protein